MNPVYYYIPNLIGYVRIVLLIVSIYFLDSSPEIALPAYFLSSFFDCLDGYAARVFGQQTVFGSGLDMIIDRVSTTCLLLYLSKYYSHVIPSILIILDFSSHYLHMLSTSRKLKSHKEVNPSTPLLMRLYYQNRGVLFGVCAGNEMFVMALYARVKGWSVDEVLLVTAPIFFFKQVKS